jgi:predicted ATPase with chaperone activity
VERPFVVVGGELTIDDLELRYSPALGYYEAPVHLKANGGTFLLDDLGCQRVDSQELLKRWIIPLEHDVDYMTLQTGQKLQVPFRQLLVISTNLDPDLVMEPAILRRMGYRLHLNYPSVEQYAAIFQRYADRRDLAVPDGLLEMLMQRYQREERPLRCCDPRDLIERVRDICRFHRRKALLSDELVNLDWKGYFGESAEVPLDAPDAREVGSPEH